MDLATPLGLEFRELDRLLGLHGYKSLRSRVSIMFPQF